MINANELRIGNCHYANGIGIKRITAQGIYYVDQGTMKFEPIPLTTEILESCGWVWNENLNVFEKPGDTRMDLQYRSVNGSFTMLNSVIGALIAKRIFFLHQLQNLYFALSGEELTVNL